MHAMSDIKNIVPWYYILLSHTISLISSLKLQYMQLFIWNKSEYIITLHVCHVASLIYFHTFIIDLGIIFIAGDLACPFSWHISHKKFDVLSTSLPPIALQHSVKEKTICNQKYKQCLSGFSWKSLSLIFINKTICVGENIHV